MLFRSLIYFDVNNRYVGINTASPQYALDSTGNAKISEILITGNVISSNTGVVSFGSTGNITISGGAPNYILSTDGAGNLSFRSISDVVSAGGAFGNTIVLGANTVPAFASNAVTLTSSTDVTDAIASLNYVLGKLVPPSPPNFPNSTTISVSGTVSGYMTNFTQTDNSGWGNLSVSGGTTVTVMRAATFTTSAVNNVGPGSSGTVTAYVNGTPNGNVTQGTFSPFSVDAGTWSSSFNGTDSWLQLSNNTAFDMGSGDFTIEGWFYQDSGGGTDQVICAKYEASNQASWYISTTSSGANWSIYLYWSDSTNTQIYNGTAPSQNQWHHFALQRNGNTVEFYVDGTRLTQVSTTKTMRTTTSGIAIGQTGNGYGSEWFSGYISNLRKIGRAHV